MRFTNVLRSLGGPVAYYPGLAKHVGGVKPAIFLCQMIYWSDKTENELGVYKSVEEWEEETGLSYREQVTARKELVERGLIIETAKRIEHRIYFLLNEDLLDEYLANIGNCGKRISRNAESAVGEVRKAHFVHTENTTENKNPCQPKADAKASIPYEKIRSIYQEVCGSVMKPAMKLTSQRESNIRACWNHSENGMKVFRSADFWRTYFQHCMLNAHWRGENGPWKASLEFLTRKSIMEPTVEELMLKLGVAYESA